MSTTECTCPPPWNSDYVRNPLCPLDGDPILTQRTMNPGTARAFERLFLTCPQGHEAGSAPLDSRHGRNWTTGDFTDWDCGYSSCEWTGTNLTDAAGSRPGL